ncbi:MAG TPA: YggT family protein [Gammaproteobacteria bacterium]|nr:YggT family protein [Gammaproteobacteria bacterium]HET7587523.1 YggT family protein [Gammaproteobacteria bacterium]
MGYFGNNANQAGVFLIDVLISLYVLAFMLRFLLQIVRADFYNPVSQALVKITNPVLKPLRRIIPGYFGVDMAALLVMFVLEVFKFVVIVGILGGYELNALAVVVFSLRALFLLVLQIFFWSILLQAVLSWVNPGSYSPVTSILWTLNEPLLRPARRILPPMGGIDFSPVAVMILLQVIRILIS